VADLIVEELSQPLIVEHDEIKVPASVGVAVTSNPRAEVGALLDHADRAMYRAKQYGYGGIELIPVLESGDPGYVAPIELTDRREGDELAKVRRQFKDLEAWLARVWADSLNTEPDNARRVANATRALRNAARALDDTNVA